MARPVPGCRWETAGSKGMAAMHARRAVRIITTVAALALPVGALAGTAQAAVPHGPAVLHVGQIDRQDVASRGTSEPDTLTEPDVAVDPYRSNVAVAAAHDSRFADGGAVDISSAWTHDGGRSWHHAPVPGLTIAIGGHWPRASDPVLAFGPDGSVYLSVLVFDPYRCPTGVAVLRSTDGGASWGRPVMVDQRSGCQVSDDKNWIVADTAPASPHYGRIYQFWTPFLSTAAGNGIGNPQWVKFSDDNGRSWSRVHELGPQSESTQDSQPMIAPDGTIVDAYERFSGGGGEQPEHPTVQRPRTSPAPAAAPSGVDVVARTSKDGGVSWSGETVIARNIGEGPRGVRCCLPSATADPRTGALYATWIGAGHGEPVLLARSTNGRTWSAPRVVSRDGQAASMTHVNVDVTAYGGRVYVSYGTRNAAVAGGRYVQQELSSSADGGRRFGAPIALGPRSDLRFAAQAGGAFPGDYIGSSATAGRLYLVWCVSATPPRPAADYHQTLYAAVLAT